VRVSAWAVARSFLWLSLTTYGGAQSAAIRREVVRRREWLSEAEFLELRSIAMVAPGPNSPNLAILVGLHLAGTAGAALAFVAATVPGIVIIMAFALLSLDPRLGPLNAALRGCAAAAVGLTFAGAVETTVMRRLGLVQLAIVAASALAVTVLHFSLWLTLLVFVPISIALAKPAEPREATPS
jgi:chromate transporter